MLIKTRIKDKSDGRNCQPEGPSLHNPTSDCFSTNKVSSMRMLKESRLPFQQLDARHLENGHAANFIGRVGSCNQELALKVCGLRVGALVGAPRDQESICRVVLGRRKFSMSKNSNFIYSQRITMDDHL